MLKPRIHGWASIAWGCCECHVAPWNVWLNWLTDYSRKWFHTAIPSGQNASGKLPWKQKWGQKLDVFWDIYETGQAVSFGHCWSECRFKWLYLQFYNVKLMFGGDVHLGILRWLGSRAFDQYWNSVGEFAVRLWITRGLLKIWKVSMHNADSLKKVWCTVPVSAGCWLKEKGPCKLQPLWPVKVWLIGFIGECHHHHHHHGCQWGKPGQKKYWKCGLYFIALRMPYQHPQKHFGVEVYDIDSRLLLFTWAHGPVAHYFGLWWI